ncbi:MAG: protein-L-isoaspartate(D-aspartate) O-methyltransferase [Pseudomonadota bacterium]|nr:protein-L-isoaspartate(D-aspartate) O-methyltransferase [Pseudomonadota bacterium]
MNLETVGKRVYLIALTLVCYLSLATEILAEPQSLKKQELKNMLTAIEKTTQATTSYTDIETISLDVMEALSKVNRAKFVPNHSIDDAFGNHPLRIGYGQTISQPFIVALMTHLLEIKPDDRILEIGTGSGYQAAVAAELASEVYTVEIVEELAHSADKLLKSMGYTNILVKTGDGWYGWQDAAPFDGILVTAVAAEVPPQLLNQLAVGGKLVMPVGDPAGIQELVLVTRNSSDETSAKDILPVRFVPMTGKGVLTLGER